MKNQYRKDIKQHEKWRKEHRDITRRPTIPEVGGDTSALHDFLRGLTYSSGSRHKSRGWERFGKVAAAGVAAAALSGVVYVARSAGEGEDMSSCEQFASDLATPVREGAIVIETNLALPSAADPTVGINAFDYKLSTKTKSLGHDGGCVLDIPVSTSVDADLFNQTAQASRGDVSADNFTAEWFFATFNRPDMTGLSEEQQQAVREQNYQYCMGELQKLKQGVVQNPAEFENTFFSRSFLAGGEGRIMATDFSPYTTTRAPGVPHLIQFSDESGNVLECNN